MFEDFDETKTVDEAEKKRMGASVVVSAALFGAFVAVGLVLGARHVAQAAEPEVEVTFEQPPPELEPVEAPPEPEEQEPEPTREEVMDARPLMEREVMEAPEEIPDEQLAESDADLAPAAASGPVDGFLTGVAGGRGSAAPSHSAELGRHEDEGEASAPSHVTQHEDATPAMQTGGCRSPEMPAAARSAGVADTVIARFRVNADGTVSDVQILRGDAIFHDAVRSCIESRTYEPARLPDGTAVASPKTQPFRFELSNL